MMKRDDHVGGRQRLLDATLHCLAEHGYHRTSVRKIAETAGVTPGLVKHHFGGKDALLVESYRYFKYGWLEVFLSAANHAELDPVKRLEAFTRSILFSKAASAEIMSIWANFVELVTTNREASAAQAATYDQFIEEISNCVVGVYAGRGESLTEDSARKLALGINSVIDGIWVECSLDPSRMEPEEALEIALDIIGARIGVSFPSSPNSGS